MTSGFTQDLDLIRFADRVEYGDLLGNRFEFDHGLARRPRGIGQHEIERDTGLACGQAQGREGCPRLHPGHDLRRQTVWP